MCAAILLLPAAPAAAQLQAHLVASGFNAPVAFVQDPSNPAVQVVVEQAGRVRVLVNGVVQPQDYLDLTSAVACCGEMGLLGLAFPPDYAASGRVYVNFTRRPDGATVVARFKRSAANPLQADPSTRVDLVWPNGLAHIPQPFANHNGGNMAFGPDGFLYIGLGDGGSGSDPMHLAQNPGSLLGKMLRINVSVGESDPEGYDVPPNPFLGQPGVLGEIWAFGLRNPWRWSFDDPSRGGTGALVIADVGQSAWEEVNYEPAGAGGRNYGWRNREGAHDHVTSLPPFSTPLVDPIHEYSHAVGGSITGGFVYRGAGLGAVFRGRYFFGDFVSSRIWSLGLNVQGGGATAGTLIEHTAELGVAATNPSSFGVDAAGELYVVSYSGAIHRLALANAPPAPPAPPPGGPPPPPDFARSNADFDGDDRPDVLWQHEDGFLHVWFMNGASRAGGGFFQPLRVDPSWSIADADDFNGDRQADLVWQHEPSGALYVWFMQGTRLVSGQPLSPGTVDPTWRLAATGDFDRDGEVDLLFQEPASSRLVVWLMNGTSRQSDVPLSPAQIDAGWRVAGTADFNHDRHIDILWQHTPTGALLAWLMDGTSVGEVASVTPDNTDAAWRVAALADFDGDSHADLVWRHESTGDLRIWFMNGTVRTESGPLTPGQVDPAWRIAGAK
jgi:glucose/arabinose dehydrogenase